MVTVTTTAVHGFTISQSVTISGVSDSSFNGTFVIASLPSTTSFTYAQAGPNAFGNGGTATSGSNSASIISGKISCGTVDASGNYKAPGAAPAAGPPGNQVSITATSVDDPLQSGSGTLTVAAGAFISKISPASITSLGAGSTDFTIKVQGLSFVASSPGPGSTILFGNTVPPTTLSTNCSSTTQCTATIPATSVNSPGDYGVQVVNPTGSPLPLQSNQVALKVLDAATEQKNLDNAPVVTLTAGNPDATGHDILVVEPTTAGSLNEHYNMDFIGIVSGGSCSLRGTGITLTRPAGVQNFDICVRNNSFIGPSLLPTDTFTISGPSPTNDITIVQVQAFGGGGGVIQITLQIESTTMAGPRTLFAESKNREKAALVGGIEVK
jgi:hypothetical protein